MVHRPNLLSVSIYFRKFHCTGCTREGIVKEMLFERAMKEEEKEMPFYRQRPLIVEVQNRTRVCGLPLLSQSWATKGPFETVCSPLDRFIFVQRSPGSKRAKALPCSRPFSPRYKEKKKGHDSLVKEFTSQKGTPT